MKWLWLLTVLVIIVSCNNEPEKTPPAVSGSDTVNVADTTAKSYFPVRDFLLSEIRYVDSLPVALMKYTTRNGKQDSGYIKLDEFHKLVEEFVIPAVDKTQLETSFKESSFYDRSSESSTFSYSPLNDQSEIKRIDVITKESNMGYSKVSSVYIEKLSNGGLKKLLWLTGKNFQLITPPDSAGKNGSIIKVVWNYWD